MEEVKMFNPILVFDGTKEEFNNLSVRQQCSHYAIHIARSLELFLEVLNTHESDVVVSDANSVLTEIELHEQIAQYMKLSESFAGEKPE